MVLRVIACAIYSTLQYCRNFHMLHIYTDSRETFPACRSRFHTLPTVQRIKQLRKTAASTARTKIILQRVPGLPGIQDDGKAQRHVAGRTIFAKGALLSEFFFVMT